MLPRVSPTIVPRAYGIPVRRSQAGQRGHEVHPVVALQRRRERFGVGGDVDHPEPVAQPLDGRAGHEDRRLGRVGEPLADPPGDGGEQAVGGLGAAGSGVLQHERTRPVGVLAQPGIDAGLAEQRGLLVTGDARHRHRVAVQRVGRRGRD